MEEEKIPARFIGIHEVTLKGRGFKDGNGNPLKENLLKPGDTLMLPASEVLGSSYIKQGETLVYLGAGHLVLPEDQDKTLEELHQAGYEFVEGRSDFEPVSDEHKAMRVQVTKKPEEAEAIQATEEPARPMAVPYRQAEATKAEDMPEKARQAEATKPEDMPEKAKKRSWEIPIEELPKADA